jgi:hypothetical protein
MASEPISKLREFMNRVSLEEQSLRRLPDNFFQELRSLTVDDEALLRCCRDLDQYATVEATRRLRETLHQEEVAIKRLTRKLVNLTWMLLFLTVIIAGLTVVLVVRQG